MTTREYLATVVRETEDAHPILLFGANAIEIGEWGGVPQRRSLDGEETVGWQRELEAKRVASIASFLEDSRNILINPLLCALQDENAVEIEYLDDSPTQVVLRIKYPDYADMSLSEIVSLVQSSLIKRVPHLADIHIADPEIAAAKRSLGSAIPSDGEDSDSRDDDEISGETDTENDLDVSFILFDEDTHIEDFYREITIRKLVLDSLSDQIAEDLDSILGFTKDALLPYLKPIVIVDGQHRLEGAGETAMRLADLDEGLQMQLDGSSRYEVVHNYARCLPVSLLFDASPAEHAFQFILVNQKAKTIKSDLLRTIVSTSLSKDELDPIADRLKTAQIDVGQAKATQFLLKDPASPFYKIVSTGMSSDTPTMLQGAVLDSLVSTFRTLRGGKAWDSSTTDYADLWKRQTFLNSGFFDSALDESEKIEFWSRPTDGAWRDCFAKFFCVIRDRFGDDKNIDAYNAWGNTRGNLYNKVSLTILLVDFFRFMSERREAFDSTEDIVRVMELWLDGVDDGYFNRELELNGNKKDSPRIRKIWSQKWYDYRTDPRSLPQGRTYG